MEVHLQSILVAICSASSAQRVRNNECRNTKEYYPQKKIFTLKEALFNNGSDKRKKMAMPVIPEYTPSGAVCRRLLTTSAGMATSQLQIPAIPPANTVPPTLIFLLQIGSEPWDIFIDHTFTFSPINVKQRRTFGYYEANSNSSA
jgi:hypothetical protein